MATVGTNPLDTILNISGRDAQFGKLNPSPIICSYKLDLPPPPFRISLMANYNQYEIKPAMSFQLILLTPKIPLYKLPAPCRTESLISTM